uniref:Annexin A1 n=1 Tax=Chelydra serpentina TaxID=8475 RepID=A0A8C3RTW3_CHESE
MTMVQAFLKQAWFMDNEEQECIVSTATSQEHNFHIQMTLETQLKTSNSLKYHGIFLLFFYCFIVEFKRDLAKDIASDTSGDFQKALLALAKGDRNEDGHVNEELADNDARALYEAGEKRKGTDINVFITILTTRSFPHLRRVFQKYTKFSQHDMNKALDLELKGDIENCLTAIVKCATSKPAFFAEKLNLAMKGSGTRQKILNRIMVSRSEVDMNEIKGYYNKLYGTSLCQAILVCFSFQLKLYQLLNVKCYCNCLAQEAGNGLYSFPLGHQF